MGTKGIGDRFARVAVGNGGLPTGDTQLSDAFLRWQKFASELTKMDTGAVLKLGVVRQLSPEEVAAYNAPFPDETYQAGVRKHSVTLLRRCPMRLSASLRECVAHSLPCVTARPCLLPPI